MQSISNNEAGDRLEFFSVALTGARAGDTLIGTSERRKILEREWSSKNKEKIEKYPNFSNVKVWWKCGNATCDHHEWEAKISNRMNGSSCPFCYGKKVCACNSLEKLKPNIVTEWHPKNKLKPSEVSLGSGKKVWWKCKNSLCNHHEWESAICDRRKRGCPFCSNQKICPCSSLEKLRPDLAAEWHPKNKLKPSEVSLGSDKKVWWLCFNSTCEHIHEWDARITDRNQGSGCPFCCRKKICLCNSLEKLRPDLAAEWHPKNKLKSFEVSLGSDKKVWWLCFNSTCEHIHEWDARISDRNKGSGCPICCISKGEKYVKELLEKKKIKYISQLKLTNKLLFFDFFLPDYNLVIEFDGIQHFEPVEYFGGDKSLQKQVQNDLLKNGYCTENKINLLRIHHKDKDEIEVLLDFGTSSSSFNFFLLSTHYPFDIVK